MKKNRISYLLIALLISGVASACQLSASKAPTAFAFQTPDLTATAIFSSVATSIASTLSSSSAATPSATLPSVSTPTSVPAVTATSAPVVPTTTPLPSATALPAATSLPLYRSVGKIVATFLQTPPNIDGDLSKWTLYQYPANYVVYGAANWEDAQDLSAKVMIGWDYSNLYLGVHVFDNQYVQNASGANLYLGDSLEILIDTNLAADFYVSSLSPDDFQLGISPGSPDPGKHLEAYLWYPITVKGAKSQVKIASQKADEGYDVEVAIPWNVFEVVPVAGQHFGFAFSVSDNDKGTANVQESMVSTVPNRHLTNPTSWGDLTLGQP